MEKQYLDNYAHDLIDLSHLLNEILSNKKIIRLRPKKKDNKTLQ